MSHYRNLVSDCKVNLSVLMKIAHNQACVDYKEAGGSYAAWLKSAMEYLWSMVRQLLALARVAAGLPVKMVKIKMGELA